VGIEMEIRIETDNWAIHVGKNVLKYNDPQWIAEAGKPLGGFYFKRTKPLG